MEAATRAAAASTGIISCSGSTGGLFQGQEDVGAAPFDHDALGRDPVPALDDFQGDDVRGQLDGLALDFDGSGLGLGVDYGDLRVLAGLVQLEVLGQGLL